MKLNESGLPFDDIRELLASLPAENEEIRLLTAGQVTERLGPVRTRLSDLCEWYSAWSGRSPVIGRPVVTLFAGTHAVDRSRDDWLLSQVTAISEGSAAINRVCHEENLGLKVLDLALQIPVADITSEAALDEKACAGTIAFGMEAIAGGTDLLCVSAVEDAITASTLALLSILSGLDPAQLAGSSVFGVSSECVALAETAISRIAGHRIDPLESLRHLGGRETSALCGAIVAARTEHIPVLVSGPTGLAAMLVLRSIDERSVDHCYLAGPLAVEALDRKISDLGICRVIDEPLTADPALQLAMAAHVVKTAAHAWQSGA